MMKGRGRRRQGKEKKSSSGEEEERVKGLQQGTALVRLLLLSTGNERCVRNVE